ncbi:MAG: RCC1 repeat protein [Clostridia bacterium]|nr:RCC1 repeat protein [Clostridia bacterium]
MAEEKRKAEIRKRATKLLAAGFYHTVGVKKDGAVVAVGNNEYGECNVSGWKLF